jgi:two-component system, chemotaxis family, protein-glutamate methylesterase/glutaminase
MANFPIVLIGAADGGLDPVRRITEALPHNCGAAVAVVFHTGAQPSAVPDILCWHGKLPVVFGAEGTPLEPGHLYVAPPDRHMLLSQVGFHLDGGSKVHDNRPAIDPLFVSAAMAFGPRVVGVVLSGLGKDGATGLRMIRNRGGLTFVQDPVEAAASEMPAAAFAQDDPEVLPIEELSRRVARFCSDRGALASRAAE